MDINRDLKKVVMLFIGIFLMAIGWIILQMAGA